ncbi:MAG TPA: hypothetical protein VHN14_33820 [Kofleriaceae bacterium]|jgi:predicted transposase YdaD|nr:hypothetical protein [Kofleriaceae bacterium]
MAGELKSEHPRERTLIDPVLKFLFDQDRDEILRLMLGTPVRVVQVLDSALPSGEQRSDGVLLVEDAGEQFLLHIEFMTRVASNMGERIFGYVPRVYQRYGAPVRSVVLYLMQPGPRTEISTEFRMIVQRREVAVIRYDVVCLWEIEPDRAHLVEHPALLALAPLMKGIEATDLEDLAELANRAPWDERMRIDVVALLTLFGGQRFGQDVVFSMTRRLGMLKDIIQESPLYELARAYGEARGEARGEVRGEARGEARGLRNACLTLTKTKAPRLAAALEARLSSSTDIAQLEKLLVDLGLAQNEEAVQSAISHYVG